MATSTKKTRGPGAKETVAAKRDREHQRASTPRRKQGEARKLIRRVGRPSAITEDLVYAIGDHVLAGNYRTVAAAANGLTRQTINNWLAKGQEYEGMDPADLDETQRLYVEFVYVLSVCEAQSEVEFLALAARAGTGWQAYLTILERRWPARWKRRDEIEHSGEVGVKKLDPSQVEEELAAFGMPAASAVAAGPGSVEAPEDA